METINSILAPANSAAKHLSHALHRIQDDFLAQAKKSGKVVKGDFGSTRADLNEAISRLGDATEQLRDSIGTSKAEMSEAMLEKVRAGTEYARALKERASALSLPDIGKYAGGRHVARNNVLIATLAAGVGYAVYRLVKRARSAPKKKVAQSAKAVASAAKRVKSRVKKSAGRAARTVNATIADGTQATPTRAH